MVMTNDYVIITFYLFSYHTDEDGWEPRLYSYQQEGANVLFFTFINPETMAVPESFKKLGKVKLYLCERSG